MQNLFFPGDTLFKKHEGRNRCLWREEQFMLHLLQRTVSPTIGLKASVVEWYEISCLLRESPRKRALKIALIECADTILLA